MPPWTVAAAVQWATCSRLWPWGRTRARTSSLSLARARSLPSSLLGGRAMSSFVPVIASVDPCWAAFFACHPSAAEAPRSHHLAAGLSWLTEEVAKSRQLHFAGAGGYIPAVLDLAFGWLLGTLGAMLSARLFAPTAFWWLSGHFDISAIVPGTLAWRCLIIISLRPRMATLS